jgi:hypothetical protein
MDKNFLRLLFTPFFNSVAANNKSQSEQGIIDKLVARIKSIKSEVLQDDSLIYLAVEIEKLNRQLASTPRDQQNSIRQQIAAAKAVIDQF